MHVCMHVRIYRYLCSHNSHAHAPPPPVGWGQTSTGHVQDPAAPYQDATGRWHVFPDCWPTTWNDKVRGGNRGDTELGWCHLTSKDLIHWEQQPPAVWYDGTRSLPNGSGFHGNCGTGGGAINARGELVVYCPHDGTGIHTFIAANASGDFARLSLVDAAPGGKSCQDVDWAPGCAMLPPPKAVMKGTVKQPK